MQKISYFIALILLLAVLSSCINTEKRIIETRINGNIVEWKYENENSWNHLLDLEEIYSKDHKDYQFVINELGELIITFENGNIENLGFVKGKEGLQGIPGEDGKQGYVGPQGIPGINGTNGREVIFQIHDGQIQWTYNGDEAWTKLIDLSSLEGSKGDVGIAGPEGPKGDIGEKGLSVYEIYVKNHPNYIKSESEWLDDFIQGKLSLSDEFDVFNLSDFDLGLSLGFHKFRLQSDLFFSSDYTFENHIELNLNHYFIEGNMIIDAHDDGIFSFHHGRIIGDVIFNHVNAFRLDIPVEGNIKTYQVNSKGEVLKEMSGVISIYSDLDLTVENNHSLFINSLSNGVILLDGTIDQFHVHTNQILIMKAFSLIGYIEIHSSNQLEITRTQTSVIGSINPLNQVTFTNEEISTENPWMLAPDSYIIGLGLNLEYQISLGRYNEITSVMIEGRSISDNYYRFEDGILSIDATYLDSLQLEVMSIDIVCDADYPLQSTIPTYEYIPNIEQVMNGYEGLNVFVSGVVTKILNNKLMFIEDESSVIAVYGDVYGINVGDSVQVNGLKNIYHGLHQITNASIYQILSQNNWFSDSYDYHHDMTFSPGMRINFEDISISEMDEDSYGNIVFYVYDKVNDVYYQMMCDARVEDFEIIKETLRSLDGQSTGLNNIILSYNLTFASSLK